MKTFVKIMIVFSLLIVGTVAGMLALLGFVCGGLNSECLQFSINNTAYAESNSQPVIIINSDSPINAPDEGNGRASDEVPNTPETAVFAPLPMATIQQSPTPETAVSRQSTGQPGMMPTVTYQAACAEASTNGRRSNPRCNPGYATATPQGVGQ